MTGLGGDFRFFWNENIKDFVTLPSAWDSMLNTGIGQSQVGSLWITSYLNLTSHASKIGLNWEWIQLLLWVLPAVVLSFLSPYLLFKFLFKDRRYSFLAGIIYLFNTYFLMVLAGGQLGVSLSYSLVPLVLLGFIRLVEKPSLRNALIAGLTLGFQIIFDPRIVYITLITTFFYFVFNSAALKRVIKKSFGLFIFPLVIASLMNIFWILPLILTKSSAIPAGFDSASSFRFFSFADFSHALSFLHPNWPENIFGKVYFLQPEFLILPILAYSSLLFISKNKNQKYLLFFALLGLVGTFLSKGANPPFGEVNTWMFQNFPGMAMFRDPTKFYVLIALSYSILIPFSIFSISEWLKSKILFKGQSAFGRKFQISNLLLIFTFLFLIFLVAPIFGQIKIKQVPQEYVELKDFLINEKTFSRTLWIPKWQRFGFFSNNHPAIGREELLKGDYRKQIEQLKKPETEQLLRELSVKYVIIPFDSEGEIFLDDRKYSEKKRQEVEKELDKISWLRKQRLNDLSHLNKIAVYEIKNSKDHFWSPSSEVEVRYGSIKPTEYKVQVKNAKQGDLLVFSESFDKNWFAQISETIVRNSEYKDLNSFRMSEGDHVLRIFYKPQKYVEAGLWLSVATLLTSLSYLLFGKISKK